MSVASVLYPWVSNTLWSTLQALLKVLCVTSTYYAVSVWKPDSFILSVITGFSLVLRYQFESHDAIALAFYVPAEHTMRMLLSSAHNYTKTQALWTAAVIWVTLQMNSENHSSTWILSLLSSGMPYSLSCLSHSFLKKKVIPVLLLCGTYADVSARSAWLLFVVLDFTD